MKNIIVVTGGAGFVGINLIKRLIIQTSYDIVSIDNYSSGKITNHIISKRIKYIFADTKDISKTLKNYQKRIKTIFHFGEFSRIYQSFKKMDQCIDSNTIGSYEVFKFCTKNKIKLIYSATSASIGNQGNDKNLSPYAFTKAKNLELLENFKKWFNLKFEIIYFYNVYGPNQIMTGSMATVIGIFERQFKKGQSLTVVKPGTQSRRFTHINDTIDVCIQAWKRNKCEHYSIYNNQSYSVIEVAKMFGSKIKYLPERKGERYFSSITKKNLSNKINRIYGKIRLVDYINNIKKSV